MLLSPTKCMVIIKSPHIDLNTVYMLHPFLAPNRQAIRIRPTNNQALCTQSNSFSNVGTTPNATVEEYLNLGTHRLHNPRQHPQAARPTIPLPSAMI